MVKIGDGMNVNVNVTGGNVHIELDENENIYDVARALNVLPVVATPDGQDYEFVTVVYGNIWFEQRRKTA